MIIKSIELCNFRNYELLEMNFHPETNILYGDNAQGKTNILESIFLAATTKSHKGSKDKEVIRMNCEEAHIRLKAEKDEILHTIDIHLKKNKKKGIAIDGLPIRKSSELVGLVQVVFFSPEDLGIIKNGPAERRRFMDMELCQMDKIYLYHLTRYNKVLLQRNNLLKQIRYKEELMDTLTIWDEQLTDCGKKIIECRANFLKELNEIVIEIHKKLTGGKEEIKLVYDNNVNSNDFYNILEKNREKDIQQKTTGNGPHRDDIIFYVRENKSSSKESDFMDIRKYGSQGQQRTAALSLKLAEIELLRKITKQDPILLLDDVLSELDRNRQNYLLESIRNIQTLITCTGLEEFVNSQIQVNKVFKIVKGTVTEENNIV